LKKGYIKLIAAIVLGAAIIGGGIYGVYTLLSSNTTTILYRSTVDDKINAIRPYIVALDTYNSYSVAYANQLQPTLEELRNSSHNTTITLPKYKDLKTALEAAKQDSSTPYEDVNQATNDVLAVLDQIIPIADQLQAYYVERRFEKDNFKIYVSLSYYEDYMSIDISYKKSTVYSGEITNIEEIKKFDTDILKVVTDKNWIFLKKWPCIGVSFEERLE